VAAIGSESLKLPRPFKFGEVANLKVASGSSIIAIVKKLTGQSPSWSPSPSAHTGPWGPSDTRMGRAPRRHACLTVVADKQFEMTRPTLAT
jgi:hypothetical protein